MVKTLSKLSGICIYVTFSVLILSGLCVAAGLGSSVHTKGGDLRVIALPGESTPDTVVFNDVRLFRNEGTFISIEKLYSFSNRDVAIISIDLGGSGTLPQYEFIVIRPGTRPVIVDNDDFSSEDGTFKIREKDEIIYIDLGYSEGFKKTGRLQGDKLTVVKESVRGTEAAKSIPKRDCDWLFSQVLRECANQQR